MTIYRLDYNHYDFPRIDISWDEVNDKLPGGRKDMKAGTSKKAIWHELNATYYYSPDNSKKAPCPDLSQWNHDLVFSEQAKKKLEAQLVKYGEFLPIFAEGEKRYIFNLLNATDAIDLFNSEKEIFDDIEMGVIKIAFLEHKVKDMFIFNTEYDGYSYTYCTDAFKALIEKSRLTSGWTFCEKLRDLEPMKNF